MIKGSQRVDMPPMDIPMTETVPHGITRRLVAGAMVATLLAGSTGLNESPSVDHAPQQQVVKLVDHPLPPLDTRTNYLSQIDPTAFSQGETLLSTAVGTLFAKTNDVLQEEATGQRWLISIP